MLVKLTPCVIHDEHRAGIDLVFSLFSESLQYIFDLLDNTNHKLRYNPLFSHKIRFVVALVLFLSSSSLMTIHNLIYKK